MFINTTTALRIDHAEAALTRSVVEAVIASGRASGAFVRALGSGVATYLRPASPMNKVIGVGLDGPIDEGALADIERQLRSRGEPVRVELSTLALPESAAQLTARGYRLLGFENVLVRSLATAPTAPVAEVRIERVSTATVNAWRQTTVIAVASSDETGVAPDQLSLAEIAAAIEDVLEARDFERYLAFLNGELAGTASLHMHGAVAQLTGSSTLPAQRRRGVQAALIAARLEEARARGADLAVITTAPGSQSQANVMKHGFALAYARAILVLPATYICCLTPTAPASKRWA
jgi:GNAT superfamily N-acetyltransferase